MKKINFFDGASSGTVPTVGNVTASNLVAYANDATYESSEQGSPIEGNIYYNTTLDLVRYYNGTSWVSIVDESTTQTLINKSIDGNSNTVTNIDGDEVIIDAGTHTPPGTAQDNIDANRGLIDSNASDISNNTTNIGNNATNISNNASDISDLQTNKQDISEKNVANGYAGLDASSKILSSQLPDSVIGAMIYQGSWDASLNSPTLSSGSGTKGHYYVVSVAGTTNLDGVTDWEIGDWAIYNGSVWEKIDNSDKVSSVNGQTGAVVLDSDDVAEGSTNEYYSDAKVALAPSVAANTAKVSADGSIGTHSDVDITTDVPKNGQSLVYDGSNFVPGDSGSGSGGINYVENPNFESESDATGHTPYKDATQEVPEDGQGGVPTLSITKSLVDPLDLTASGLVSKPASNVQGEGIRILMDSIALTDRGKINVFSMEYDLSESNVLDGDFAVFFRDDTNGNIIRMNGEDIKAGKGTHYARVQVPIDCENASILLHCKATHTDAYDFKYDRVSFGPQKLAYGTYTTDAVDFTPTGSLTTNVTYSGSYYRKGEHLGAEYLITLNGTNTQGTVILDIPSTMSVDNDKIKSSRFACGRWLIRDDSANLNYSGEVFYEKTSGDLYLKYSTSSFVNTNSNTPIVFEANDLIQVTIYPVLPITGWSSQTTISEDFGGRDVIANYSRALQSIPQSTTTIVIANVKKEDTTSSYNSSTGVFTAPETGYYDASIVTKSVDDLTGTEIANIVQLNKNNGTVEANKRYDASNNGQNLSGDYSLAVTAVKLVKGDTLQFEVFTDDVGGMTLNDTRVSFAKRSSSQTSLETEQVALRYSTNSGQSIPFNVQTKVTYEDLDYDTHNAYSNGVFTAPQTGKYLVNASFYYAATNINASTSGSISIAKNNLTVSFTTPYVVNPTGTIEYFNQISDTIDLDKGDTLQISALQTFDGTAKTLAPSGSGNVLTIAKLK